MLTVQFVLRIGSLLSKLPLYDLATLAAAAVAASAAASAVAAVANVGLRTKRYLLSSLCCFFCCCRDCCSSLENGCWRSCRRLLCRCKLSFAVSACCPGEQLTVVLFTSSSCCCCCSCCSPSQVVVVVLLSLCISCCRSVAIFPLSNPRPCPIVVNCFCSVVSSLALAAAAVVAPFSISTEAAVDAP